MKPPLFRLSRHCEQGAGEARAYEELDHATRWVWNPPSLQASSKFQRQFFRLLLTNFEYRAAAMRFRSKLIVLSNNSSNGKRVR